VLVYSVLVLVFARISRIILSSGPVQIRMPYVTRNKLSWMSLGKIVDDRWAEIDGVCDCLACGVGYVAVNPRSNNIVTNLSQSINVQISLTHVDNI
jgi:hypothetical protein